MNDEKSCGQQIESVSVADSFNKCAADWKSVRQTFIEVNAGVEKLLVMFAASEKVAANRHKSTSWALGFIIPVLVSMVLMLVKLVFFP